LKPLLEHLPLDEKESFVVKDFDYAYYPTPWHYHPEYELVLVTESTGKRFVGDHVSDFAPGNLAFIGSNLPHLYRNAAEYYNGTAPDRAKSIVVHFLEKSFGADFFQLPETASLRRLFRTSALGMDILGEANHQVSSLMRELVGLGGLARMLKLLEILHVLAATTEYRLISSAGIVGQNERDTDRLHRVFEYVMAHFQQDIRLPEAANLAAMSQTAFSRYFRQRTRKTFSDFVIAFRLSHASKRLIETQWSIAEICFDCGFNNLSNFNRQFKKQYDKTPLEFRREYVGAPAEPIAILR
jgi:AraC-like DNA-binding protein